MFEIEGVKATTSRLILIRELATEPKKFNQLRTGYFGEARAKANKATTSFYNKLKDCQEKGLIVKSTDAYTLTELGKKFLAMATELKIDLKSLKSEAQVRHEQKA